MLPSKKILIALALLIVGIIALAVYGYIRGSDTNYSAGQNLLSVVTSPETDTNSQIDSDHDNLPDWQEALYGTDPHNPDTDGDGTPDGQEITLGRNPLIKGPKDFLTQKDDATTTSKDEENLTPTDAFARDFFTKYMSLQKSGVQVTSDNADQIASDYLKSSTLPGISAKQYSQKDLLVTNSEKTDISIYQQTMSSIFTKYWPSGKNNELTIMQQSFSKGDTGALVQLAPTISSYQTILDKSIVTPVPKPALALHLNLINSLSTYIQTLKMVEGTYTDSLSGLVGLNAYEKNNANLFVATTNLRLYFINSLK